MNDSLEINKASEPLTIAILEPAFERMRGHYADVTLRICQEIILRGHNVKVFASKKIAPEALEHFKNSNLEIIPYFRKLTKLPRMTLGHHLTLLVNRWLIGKDFAHLPPFSFYVWPTLDKLQLIPNVNINSERIIIAGIWFAIPRAKNILARIQSGLTANWRQKYIVGVYDNNLADPIRELHGNIRLHRLPVPYDGKPTKLDGKDFTVGIFGHLRKERGQTLLEELVGEIKSNGWNLNVNGQHGQLESYRLEENRQTYLPDLAEEIAKCHFIIWPSDAEYYQDHTSGITFQAIANGTPILVPSDCLPAKILDDYNLDYPRFRSGDVIEMMDAAKQLTANYSRHKKNALAAAERWKKTEGVKNYVDKLFDLAKLKNENIKPSVRSFQ